MPGFDKPTLAVAVPDHVMHREVLDEAVLLNLQTERYTGLDHVAVDMLRTLSEASSVQDGIDRLADGYDADRSVIAADIDQLLDQLIDRGLVVVDDIAA